MQLIAHDLMELDSTESRENKMQNVTPSGSWTQGVWLEFFGSIKVLKMLIWFHFVNYLIHLIFLYMCTDSFTVVDLL